MTIRQAGPADTVAVEALVQAAYGHYPATIGVRPGPLLDDYPALIAENRAYVLEDEEGVGALLVLIPEAETMLLDNVAVHPRAQGRGYGKRMIAFAEAQTRALGLPAIRLYTHEKMVENIALYTRYGFVETHRAFDKNLHRVFMTKWLDA